MKRWAIWAVAATTLVLVAGVTEAVAQGTFTIPFTFQAGGASHPKGEYSVVQRDDSHITLRQESTGKEFPVLSRRGWRSRVRLSPSPSLYSTWLGTSRHPIRNM